MSFSAIPVRETPLAKKPKPGPCVHCLRHSEELNWDHVFPLSWYPDTTPANEEKWKIPSCPACNAEYGRIERDLLIRLGHCLDPDDPASKSIVEKAIRAVRASAAGSEKDRKARAAKRQAIRGELMQGADIPREATYPGMGERWNRPVEEQVAIGIPVESVQRMTEKIARGLFFIEDGKLIEPPFQIEHFPVHADAAQPVKQLINRFGKTHSRPPGLIVRRAVVPDDGMSSLFEITFWGQFVAYATVLSPHRAPIPAQRPAIRLN
jgi:hypothetical protein